MDVDGENSISIKAGHGVSYSSHLKRARVRDGVGSGQALSRSMKL